MPEKIKYLLLGAAFIAGQAMMLFSKNILFVPGAAVAFMSLACAFMILFGQKLPRLEINSRLWAFFALCAAAFSAWLLAKSGFPAALSVMFISGAVFCFFKNRAAPFPAFEEKRIADIKPQPFMAWELFFFIVLAAAAYFTRMYAAGDFPAGVVEHEARIAANALNLSEKQQYIPYVADHHANWSSLLFYQVFYACKKLGWSVSSLRFFPALYGFLSVLALYFTARKITSPVAAAVASVLYVSSCLHMNLSRQVFPGSMLFLPGVLALSFFIDGMSKKHGWIWFLLSGLAAGFALHGYFAGRVFPFMMAGWLIWVFIIMRKERLPLLGLAAFAAGFYLSSWPVVNFAVTRPHEFSNYISAMGYYKGGLMESAAEMLKKLSMLVPMNLGAFFKNGTIDYSLHLPLEPLVEPVSMYFFAAGLAVLVFSFAKPVPSYLLLLLVAGFLPSVMANFEFIARRSLMALPAIFLITALPVEWMRRLLNKNNSRRMDAAVLLAGLAAAGFGFYQSTGKFFSSYCQSPGIRLQFNYNMYLAQKEMGKYPQAVVYLNRQVETTSLSGMAVFDRRRVPVEYTDNSIYFKASANQKEDALFLVPPFLEGAARFFKEAYPKAKVSVFREKNPDDQYYSNGLFSMEPWLKYIEPFNKQAFLMSVFVKKEDIDDFHSSLFGIDAGKSEPVFTPAFGEANKGRKMNLAGMFVLNTGDEATIFSMKWPGWRIFVDSAEVKAGVYAHFTQGMHYFRLAGAVPQNASGPLPFEIESGGVKLVEAGRVGAYSKPTGLKLSMWPGDKSWDKGAPAVLRYEVFPSMRFYGDEGASLPCSARLEGFITVPETGAYEFYTEFMTRVKMRVKAQVVFDNTHQLIVTQAKPSPIWLKAGEKAAFTVDMMVPFERIGINTFVVIYKKEGKSQGEIAPFEWFSPY